MDKQSYAGRLALQQRVLPAYRAPFFDLLALACDGGLSVFAGQPLPQEGIAAAGELHTARFVSANNIHLAHPGSPLFQCWQPGLIDWLEACQPDALIVEANPRNRSTPEAVRWMHARNRPVIGWGLGAPPVTGPLAGWRQRSRLRLLDSLDGLIAYSQRGAEEYRRLGFPEGRLFVAPNAAARRPSSPPPARAAAFEGSPRVLFVGRLQARKRVDLLLRACAALPPGLQPQLTIVGEGPARLELEALARQVYPGAEFTGDRRGEELASFFAAADLFVLPGTGGLAVQQAMAAGLPVIVAEGDGTQDDWLGAGNGWRVAPGNQRALTNALQEALSDPARLRRMGDVSYRIVSEEVSLEGMVSVFVQALNAVQFR